MFKLPFVARSQPSRPQNQPLSPRSAEKSSRLPARPSRMGSVPTVPSAAASSFTPRPASSSTSRATRSPINEGTLCPKGSNALLLALNPHRMKSVLYRAPYSDKWETKTLDWALDQIAQRVKDGAGRRLHGAR